MSTVDRQSRLLVAEDWKRIYQSFRNADFQSYDFDNLRRTMITYLRNNYPEDFNDYIESSEYLALIDLIAFLGQNISFRVDLNARENFLETAERRESILRLARMLSYNPRRNQAANGLLRIDTVRTTENVLDSSGLNLGNITVKWNDNKNANYFEQFTKIVNAALPKTNKVGNPLKNATIENVQTSQYRFNATNVSQAIFPFSKSIEGVSTRFEVVSSTLQGENIVEEAPLPGVSPAFLFRDDGQGVASSNTGFFMHFRQGKIQDGTFSLATPVPNQTVAIDAEKINDTDVWLYEIDSNGVELDQWTKLEAIKGNNIIYNSLFNNIRKVYSVSTRIGDRINLVFSDGVFGDLPSGNYKTYFRSSDSLIGTITPAAMGNIEVVIPYQSVTGSQETLTLTLKLAAPVTNGSASESNNEIRQNAPAAFYIQNRLITAEDYNLGPLQVSQDIIKTKSVNRVSSGISRYFDLKDATGKYSNTKIFAEDGVLYKEYFNKTQDFVFGSQSDIEGLIVNTLEPIIKSNSVKNFYYDKFPKINAEDLNAAWSNVKTATNEITGYFLDVNSSPLPVGLSFTTNNLKLIEVGALLKFKAPAGKHFMVKNNQNVLMDGEADHRDSKTYLYATVDSIVGDGTTIQQNGKGPITFKTIVPDGAILKQIIPSLSKIFTDDIKVQIIDKMFAYKNFAIRYDYATDREWKLILSENVNSVGNFSLGKTGDISGQNLDSSWIINLTTDGQKYIITHRNARYNFESANEVKFFFDSADKIYDPSSGKTFRDTITVLNINTKPDELTPFNYDLRWLIDDAYRDAEGYIDTRKLQLTFLDDDDNGVFDDPEVFEEIVKPETNVSTKYIFQKRYVTTDGVESFKYIDNIAGEVTVVTNEAGIAPYSSRTEGQIFYLIEEAVFKILNKSANNTEITTEYKAFIGRDKLKFSYSHVADSNHRIDPSVSNIIDTFVLTNSYDTAMRNYVSSTTALLPIPPSNDELFRTYGAKINAIKSISDDVVYHPGRYKVLFGSRANDSLQTIFKIVKNSALVTNENELKSEIVQAVDAFFELENWDFGETFFFQELSSYIMNKLSPKLRSIIVVPRQKDQVFGSLFQIKSEMDEVFISDLKVSDIEVIDELTASSLQATGTVITSADAGVTTNTVSATSTTTSTITNSSSSSSSSSQAVQAQVAAVAVEVVVTNGQSRQT